MARIYIFGDSHTRALKNAQGDPNLLYSSLDYDVHWMQSEKNGVIRGDLRYEDALNDVSGLNENDYLVISLLGTYHNIVGLIEHEIPFYLAEDDQSEHVFLDRCLIPASIVSDMFIEFCKKNNRIAALKKATRAQVFHLATPPPKGDNAYIKSKINRYRDKVIGEYDINPSTIRLKLWQLEMQALSDVCRGYGISFLPPPVEAVDEAGFLRVDYYADDGTHANKKYGILVLSQLEKLRIGSIV
jgi:hypothetical protein